MQCFLRRFRLLKDEKHETQSWKTNIQTNTFVLNSFWRLCRYSVISNNSFNARDRLGYTYSSKRHLMSTKSFPASTLSSSYGTHLVLQPLVIGRLWFCMREVFGQSSFVTKWSHLNHLQPLSSNAHKAPLSSSMPMYQRSTAVQ